MERHSCDCAVKIGLYYPSWVMMWCMQADHIFSWIKPGHQVFTLKVYISALTSRMTICKMSPINLFRTLFEDAWSQSPVVDPGSLIRRGVREGTPFSKAQAKGFGAEAPHICLRKLRKKTQFWVNNEAKLTKNWGQLLCSAAASAICCTNMVKNEVGM